MTSDSMDDGTMALGNLDAKRVSEAECRPESPAVELMERAREWFSAVVLHSAVWETEDHRRIESLASLLTQVRNETLEEAAKASESFCGLFDLPEPGDGPFTQQDKTIAQCQSGIANAVRALKATPAIQVGTPAAPLSPGDEVQKGKP